MFITGGLINSAHSGPQGRLEFRVIEKQGIILAAVFDFTPSLPWYIYKVTQALCHIAVMRLFAWHLKNPCI
jgi:hypothetical protein